MKRTTTWVAATMVVGSGLVLSIPGWLGAQERVPEVAQCPAGMEEGDLGISGLDCVGECTLTIREGGADRSWFFSTEPKILGVERGGPADGILRTGDYLVAIDGVLITTREGGRRYANLEPGTVATVRYRRDGRIQEAGIRVRAGCREVPEPPTVTGRVAPPPPPPKGVSATGRAIVAPQVRVAPERRSRAVTGGTSGLATDSRRATRGLFGSQLPTGRIGIGFSCQMCGTQTDEETGEDVWFFSGPLEVTAVEVGGPADEAGIQRGDLIKAIDGHDIDTDQGGLAFTRITPGESVRLTVVKRNGSEVELSLMPQEDQAVGLAAGVAVPSRRAVGVTPAPPAVPDPVAVPVEDIALDPPEGFPLRYSGEVDGVEIEVRGGPVTVSELKGSRTLYINADGLWIRITVPRRTILQDGQALGVGSVTRR